MNQKKVFIVWYTGLFFLCFSALPERLLAQNNNRLIIPASLKVVAPFEKIDVVCLDAGILSVKDSKGREYVRLNAGPLVAFNAGGAAGMQTVSVLDKAGNSVSSTTFLLEAPTNINDGGKIKELFDICYNGMISEGGKGFREFKYKGKGYNMYVSWDLDNNNVMNGIQYFVPHGNGLTDLLRETQREDGMIWSFVSTNNGSLGGSDYYKSAYAPIHFYREDGDAFFVRQPVDNHSDYNYVNMFYKHWKASGDNEWMQKTLPSAARALDYCFSNSIRWSKRFQLLKRPYCIDSWDFQVDDEYTPAAPISPTMVIVPGKTKYGVFFGDNTGYYEACNQVAEMYDSVNQKEKAAAYRQRGADILKNIEKLSWNGKYFTHFIDEDATVKRKLGVDEKSQIAQGNMYSINRGLPHEINKAIIQTYRELKGKLPVGSPGEWYSIYPPFEKGFGSHNAKWQYMNGGIAGHAIGELARGAYENGFETYGSDILERLLAIGKRYSNKIWFSYTGSMPAPPPAPVFKTIDITQLANMDLRDTGGNGVFTWMNATKSDNSLRVAGNDMRGLPVGNQMLQNIKFNVIDPDKNNRKAVIGLSTLKGFPTEISVPVNDVAGSVYLLHSSSDNVPSNVAGAITFEYADGSHASQYLMKNKHVANWWFPALQTERSGVAWFGPNLKSTKVGVCWAVLDNPFPEKKISKLMFNAPLEGGIYALLGITLADKPFYIAPTGESFGGPDNWAAANGMAALVEGLAGVKNEGLAFNKVAISPRWSSAAVDSVNVTINLPASNGYIAYQYKNNSAARTIDLYITGSGNQLKAHVLLPKNVSSVSSVTVGNKSLPYKISTVEDSKYVDFALTLPSLQKVAIRYQ